VVGEALAEVSSADERSAIARRRIPGGARVLLDVMGNKTEFPLVSGPE